MCYTYVDILFYNIAVASILAISLFYSVTRPTRLTLKRMYEMCERERGRLRIRLSYPRNCADFTAKRKANLSMTARSIRVLCTRVRIDPGRTSLGSAAEGEDERENARETVVETADEASGDAGGSARGRCGWQKVPGFFRESRSDSICQIKSPLDTRRDTLYFTRYSVRLNLLQDLSRV